MDGRLFQSASLLPIQSGQALDKETACEDGFYAVSDIFTFCATSEIQFLNAVESLIDESGSLSDHRAVASMDSDMHTKSNMHTTSDLEYYQRVLSAHVKALRDVLSSIEGVRTPTWPRPQRGSRQREIADDMIRKQIQDYSELIQRGERLSKRCVSESVLLMNKIMMEYTLRGLSQSLATARLTFLAYLFVPITFTASFFGMNFQEIEGSYGPKLSIWIWFLVSAPILGISLVLWYFGEEVTSMWRRKISQRKELVA